MYRYLVFAYDEYYPAGGMGDCLFKSNDILTVRAGVREARKNFATVEVYDCLTNKVYYEFERECEND